MKRLWIAIGILVLLCAATLVNGFCLNSLTGALSQTLVQAQRAVEEEDWQRAAAMTAQADQHFRENAFYLHVTLRHDDIDTVETSFREVLELLGHRERAGEYAAANARLISLLELLAESEHPSLRNIL